MRRVIPANKVNHDYEKVLSEFVSALKNRLGEYLLMVYLTGSYARGDANDNSDLDVFCIFSTINQYVLENVGHCARNTSIPYDLLEINTQCLSVDEYKSKIFEDWSEYAIAELNSVLLYGEQLVKIENINEKIQNGDYPNVKYTCVLREGIPEEEILYYIRQEKPLIVVMGTRGEHQKDLDLIGSVTAEVIERSRSFVYAIPENAPEKSLENIHKIALFTSFDQRDLIAFDSLITTFKDNKFEISFIHVNSHEEKRTWNEIKLAGIKEYFKKQYPQLEFTYLNIDEDHLLGNLDQFVQENGIDVICTSNYKRNIFARLFNPSIARKMLFHSNTPILIIK